MIQNGLPLSVCFKRQCDNCLYYVPQIIWSTCLAVCASDWPMSAPPMMGLVSSHNIYTCHEVRRDQTKWPINFLTDNHAKLRKRKFWISRGLFRICIHYQQKHLKDCPMGWQRNSDHFIYSSPQGSDLNRFQRHGAIFKPTMNHANNPLQVWNNCS